MTNKKILFAFCVITFSLFFMPPALAGNIRALCTCRECSGDLVEVHAEADNTTRLDTNCDIECREADCVSGVANTRFLTCMTAGEVIASGATVCAVPETTTTQTPRGSGATTGIQPIDVPNPLGITNVPVFIGRIISAALGIVGSLALLMFIYGGFLWLLSQGDARQIDKGKKTILWAALGLVVVFASYAVVHFILNSFTGAGGETATNEETGGYTCTTSERGRGGICIVDGGRRPDLDRAACGSVGEWQSCE